MQSRASNQSTLAPTLLPLSGNRTAQDVILVLAGTALIAIAAKIKVPFVPVPMTLQTLAIMLIAATYGFRLGTMTVVAYLAEGLLGLPVFTNTPPAVAGPIYFLGPTGGFLAGFVVLAMVTGHAADRGWDRSIIRLFSAMAVGKILLFAMGFAWLAWLFHLPDGGLGIGVERALAGGVTPFIWGAIFKTVLAALLVPAAWSLLGQRKA